MKNDCNVARDLMPLCIDGAASEESQQYVDEHVAECSECSDIYGEMSAALPQKRKEKETAALEKAARNLRTRRTVRALWAIIISMMALLIVIVANAGAVEQMLDDIHFRLTYVGKNNEMRLEAFHIRLIQTEDSYYSSAKLDVHSNPCGDYAFTPDVILRYDELTGDAYLRIRFYYTREDRQKDREGRNNYYWQLPGTLYYEPNDCIYYSSYDPSEEEPPTNEPYYDDVELTRIELAYGDEITILWTNADGLPAHWYAGELTQNPIATPTPQPSATPTRAPTATPTPTASPTPTAEPTPKPSPALPWRKR